MSNIVILKHDIKKEHFWILTTRTYVKKYNFSFPITNIAIHNTKLQNFMLQKRNNYFGSIYFGL